MAFLIIVTGLVTIGLPVTTLTKMGGWISGGHGQNLVPTACFLVGSSALAAAMWASLRALPTGTTAQHLGTVLLGLVSLAYMGGTLRESLQVAALHDFYIWGSTSLHRGAATVYWGITLLGLTSLAFILPSTVVLANVVPRSIASRYSWLQRFAVRRWLLIGPIVGSVAIVAILFILPGMVRTALGYSAPSFTKYPNSYSVNVLNESLLLSLARIAFLPLLVGMWEGMEFARASLAIANRDKLGQKIFLTERDRVRFLIIIAVIGGAVVAIIERQPYFAVAALVLSTVTVLATTKKLPGVVTTPRLQSVGVRLGLPPTWQSIASIGLILAVLAAPVYLPLGFDLWQGVSSPFRLIRDAGGYVYFWHYEATAQVPNVSIMGIFGNGLRLMAEYSAAAFVFLILGVIFAVITRDKDVGKIGPVLWLLARLALIAVALFAVVDGASEPAVVVIVGGAALFVMFLAKRPTLELQRFALAVLLLWLWAYVVWHYVWFPSYAVLGAAIIWRVLFDAKEINEITDDDQRFRKIAGFFAIMLLGIGLLAMDHGGAGYALGSSGFSDVTDRIAVIVVAPLCLIHFSLVRIDSSESESAASGGG